MVEGWLGRMRLLTEPTQQRVGSVLQESERTMSAALAISARSAFHAAKPGGVFPNRLKRVTTN
jgi:hypothetical protein